MHKLYLVLISLILFLLFFFFLYYKLYYNLFIYIYILCNILCNSIINIIQYLRLIWSRLISFCREQILIKRTPQEIIWIKMLEDFLTHSILYVCTYFSMHIYVCVHIINFKILVYTYAPTGNKLFYNLCRIFGKDEL